MKRVLLTAAALGIGALTAPAGHAANADVIHGGCGFDTYLNATLTGGQYEGVIYDASVTTTGDAQPLPIGATVTCWIDLDGVEVPGTRHSYGSLLGATNVQAGADPIVVPANDSQWMLECESVVFADGTTQDDGCPAPDQNLPPQAVIDVLNAAFGAADEVLCPQLAKLAGSYPGGITIGSDGDVYGQPDPLGLGPLYDCPPWGPLQ